MGGYGGRLENAGEGEHTNAGGQAIQSSQYTKNGGRMA